MEPLLRLSQKTFNIQVDRLVLRKFLWGLIISYYKYNSTSKRRGMGGEKRIGTLWLEARGKFLKKLHHDSNPLIHNHPNTFEKTKN